MEDNGIYNIVSGEEIIKAKTIVIATGILYKPTYPRKIIIWAKVV